MAEPRESFYEVAGQLIVVELIKVLNAEILKGALSLQQVITRHEQGVADGHDGSLATSFCCDSLEECSEVALLGSRGTPGTLAELLS